MKPRPPSLLAALAPPLTSHGSELEWVLARGFGPPQRRATVPAPERALMLVQRLGLGARIASRTPQLEGELGPEAARRLTFGRLQVMATGRELHAAMQRVTDVARTHSIPIAWLKFAALSSRKLIVDGSREARDVDVLAPRSRLSELNDALIASGMESLPGDADHHLPPLRFEGGAIVELHARLWGVELGDNRGSGFDELAASGALCELSPGLHVPQDWLLGAHALVHGIVQHRGTPQDYAPMRALCDAVDLRLWEQPLERAHAAVRRRLALSEVQSLAELARALAEGASLRSLAPTRAGAALAGLLAASLNARYQRVLMLQHAFDLLRAGDLHEAVARTVQRWWRSG